MEVAPWEPRDHRNGYEKSVHAKKLHDILDRSGCNTKIQEKTHNKKALQFFLNKEKDNKTEETVLHQKSAGVKQKKERKKYITKKCCN